MKILQIFKNKSFYETIIRYLLGLMMLPYGISKILRTQFVILPFQNWSEPLKDISGITLTWAFLGYSPWFTVMLGLLEVVPAILLLFRKTRLLGALILLPVSLNVFLINIALELWPGTQMISGVLLFLNLAILAFNYQILADFIKSVLKPLKSKSKSLKIEWVVNMIIIIAISALTTITMLDYINQRDFLTGDWYNSKPDYWILKDKENPDKEIAQLYFHPYKEVTSNLRNFPDFDKWRYELDTVNQVISLKESGKDGVLTTGKYQLQNNDTLIWYPSTDSSIMLVRQYLRD